MFTIGTSLLLAISNCIAIEAWRDYPSVAHLEAFFCEAKADEVDKVNFEITNQSAESWTDFLGTGDRAMSLVESLGRALNGAIGGRVAAKRTENRRLAQRRSRTFEQLEPRMMMSVSQNAAGWTVVSDSADTRNIFVSNSTGNDANDGLSEATAKKSIAAGMTLLRAGMPDHLLMKRGDTFTNQSLGNGSIPDGRSAQEPIYIGAYGTGDRPKILTGSSSGASVNGGDYIVFQGLYFRPHTRAVGDGPVGIGALGSGGNVIIEDCYITEYKENILFQGNSVGSFQNIQIRRNIIVDAYFQNSGFSQGIYLWAVSDALIEENVLDHNGWSETVADADGRVFNHQIYLDAAVRDPIVRGNIFSRSSGLAVKVYPNDGTMVFTDNLLTHNGDNALLGAAIPDWGAEYYGLGVVVTIEDNVMTEGRPQGGIGDGRGIEIQNVESGTFNNNLAVNAITAEPGSALVLRVSTQTSGPVGGVHDLEMDGNVFYNYRGAIFMWEASGDEIEGVTFTNNYVQDPNKTQSSGRPNMLDITAGTAAKNTFANNTYYRGGDSTKWFWAAPNNHTFTQWQSTYEATAVQEKVDFFDPTRTTVTYAALFGLTTFDTLMAEMRQQSQTNWRKEFTPHAVNDYMRAGFLPDLVKDQLPDASETNPPPLSPPPIVQPPPAPVELGILDDDSGASNDLSPPVSVAITNSIPQITLDDVNSVTTITRQRSRHRFATSQGSSSLDLLLASDTKIEALAAEGGELERAGVMSGSSDTDEDIHADNDATSSFEWIRASRESARDRVFGSWRNSRP